MSSLLKRHRDYLTVWERGRLCQWPDCDCKKAHDIYEATKKMAARIGCDFVVDKYKLASTPMCRLAYDR